MEDKLNRLPLIKNLTTVLDLSGAEKGLVLGVDAGWGKGKTTFLNLWGKYLEENKKDEYNIINFNAWENDDSQNPLLSLVTELEILETVGNNELFSQLKKFIKEQSKEKILKTVGNIVLNITGNLVEKATDGIITKDILEVDISDPLENEKIRRSLKKSIRASIEKLASTRKIIFFIDELDRCRPLYAIELLETIKHLFNTKNCIFIIAWDKTQLSHSIKTVYGSEMDSDGYLRRFIDLEYQLPEPSRDDYIKYKMELEGFNMCYYTDFYNMLPIISNIYELSLRDIDKLIFSLRIHFQKIEIQDVSLNEFDRTFSITSSFLSSIFSILKIKNSNLYVKIRDKNYFEKDILNIINELKGEELKEALFKEICSYTSEILRTYLSTHINGKDYKLFKGEGFKEFSMKNFYRFSSLFSDIDFFEKLVKY